jgi:hypothetical protein
MNQKRTMGNFRPDLKTIVDEMTDRPGVKTGKSFGFPSYKAPNGKVFAFVGSKGLTLKLPEDRVEELVAEHEEMKPFSPGEDAKVVWKTWIVIDHPDAAQYPQYQNLIDESMEYVMS